MNPHLMGKEDGFTLIELVTVIILVAFLSIALLAYYRPSDTELISQTNVLKTHIRYAQARAMNTNTLWGIRFEVDQQEYWLFKDANIGERILLPGQSASSVDLDKNNMGLDITGADFNLIFDGWGRPSITDRAFTNGQLVLYLNRNGTDGDPITITENTGFIP